MSDHINKTIQDLEAKLHQHQAEVLATKRLINQLCSLAGLELRYADADQEESTLVTSIRSDSFYGRPLATVVEEYLQLRRGSSQGAATAREIHDALERGGYRFDTADRDNAIRGLRISLTKNPKFHKLPNGTYGLSRWYPAAKASKRGAEQSNGDATNSESPDTGSDDGQ